eukprot:11847997-Alexandrium_andersonii.AAC.1
MYGDERRCIGKRSINHRSGQGARKPGQVSPGEGGWAHGPHYAGSRGSGRIDLGPTEDDCSGGRCNSAPGCRPCGLCAGGAGDQSRE